MPAGLEIGLAIAAGLAVVLFLWLRRKGIDPRILERRYADGDRFLSIAGARVRVREEGPPDAPVLFLLHGFTHSLESWDGWSRTLAKRNRVIRYDLLGHGLTGPDLKKRYAPVARAAFLGEVMDALGVDAASVAGNSLGGLAAWRFAADNPARVKSLILISPGAYSIN
ncbi:MAG TPA: alpha/beta fold hydrolase, partial [Parvularculaceae bacterium]|nr:alpha/beta fold hydrolase [Parvularculaceae bacterium]